MPAPKVFNNVIIGQFVLTGIPIKVYTSGRFLTLTDADDIEDALIGFGMDEHGEMVQFSYPEVEFLQVNGNKIDIATYNKGMETLHSGDEAPAQKEPEDEEDPKDEDEKDGEAKSGPSMSDHYNPGGKDMKLKDLISESILGQLPSERNMIKMKYNPLAEISQDEADAEQLAIDAMADAADAKIKAAKEKEKELKKKPIEDVYVSEDHDGYKFGTGDIVNDKDPGCPHFGSKGIVIDLPNAGEVKYSVTNGDKSKSYRPGDVLTKQSDQLEKM